MGCATSSPFITSNGGGILESAKGAATDAVHAGEEAIHDVKGTITDTAVHVKDAVVGAAQHIGHGIENAINGKKEDGKNIQDIGVLDKVAALNVPLVDDAVGKRIPLKDETERIADKTLDDLADTINTKSKEIQEEAEKLTDELIKDTEDVVTETVTSTKETVTNAVSDVLGSSPRHSIDSLKTNSPEPEIEKAMANDAAQNPPTPKPTYSELEKLQADTEDSDKPESNTNHSNGDSTNPFETGDTSKEKEDSRRKTEPDDIDKLTKSNHNFLEIKTSSSIDGGGGGAFTPRTHSRHRHHTKQNKKKNDEKDFDFGTKNLSVETSWEKLADAIINVPASRVRGSFTTKKLTKEDKSASVDNIMEYCKV